MAEEIGVGLIVMGSRGRGGILRALMGSVSNSVVRLTDTNIDYETNWSNPILSLEDWWLIKNGEMDPYGE